MMALGSRVVSIRRYFAAYGRLVREHLPSAWLDLLLIVGATFASAAAQGSAIGTLMLFAKLMDKTSKGQAQPTGFWQPNARSLLVVSAILITLLLIAAGCKYLGHARGRYVARRTQEKLMHHTLRVFASAPLLPNDDPFDLKRIRRIAMRAPRLTGYGLATLLDLIHPLVHTIVFLGFMLKLDLEATGILMLMLLLPSPLVFKLNSHVRDTARRFYSGGEAKFGTELAAAFKELNYGNLSNAAAAAAAVERVRTSETIQTHLDTLDHLKLATSRSQLITGVFRPVFLVAALGVLGFRALHDPVVWPTLLAYIVLVNQFMNHAQSLAASGAVMSRYYTQVIELHAFEDYIAAVLPRVTAEPEPIARSVVTPAQVPDGALERLEILPGSVMQLQSRTELGRITLGHLLTPVRKASRPTIPWAAARFVARGWMAPPVTLAELVTGRPSDTATVETARRTLISLGLSALAAQAEGMPPECTPPELLAVLSMLPELERGGLVLVDARVARQVDDPVFEAVVARGREACVLVVTQDPEMKAPAATHVIAVRDDVVDAVGTMEWWDEGTYAKTLVVAPAEGDYMGMDDDFEYEEG